MTLEEKKEDTRQLSHTKALTEKEEVKGFHVQLPAKLHTAFKTKAASKNEKMKDIIIRMVKEYTDGNIEL